MTDAYRAAGGDCGPDELMWFYATQRALVRAKIALLRAVAERSAWRARGPMALVICGAPASGKSQLAATVAARFAAPVINSDTVRKQLAGRHPTQRAPTEPYDTEINHRTYGEVRIARAAAREHDPARVSDATADLARDEHDAFDPLDEIAPDRHLALQTDRRTPGVLADLLALLDAQLANERDDRSSRSRV